MAALRAILVFVAWPLTGCASGTGVEIDRASDTVKDAESAYARAHDLRPRYTQPFPRVEPPSGPAPTDVIVSGLGPAEAVVTATQTEKPPQLAFRTPPGPAVCGQNLLPVTSYRVTEAKDGSIVILRMVPVPHVKEVRQAGTCGVGCGNPPVPQPPQFFMLGKPSRVTVVDVPIDVEVVHVTCEHSIPLP